MPESLTDISRSFIDISVEGQTLRLHSSRFAEWIEEKTLFIADAHLGKIEHFRRAGIGLPPAAGDNTFYRLSQAIELLKPERVIFLGDLFHSDYNEDFPKFYIWRNNFPAMDVWLIPGNHDRAGMQHLGQMGLQLEKPQKLGPFFLRHEPGETELGFLLCGHIHPSVSLTGKGRQHIRVPAFWQSKNALCLPAFGTFTGAARIFPAKEDVFYAVSGGSIRRIPAAIL